MTHLVPVLVLVLLTLLTLAAALQEVQVQYWVL
jgi:hypothetical protein